VLPALGWAQAFPDQADPLVVPYPAGGTTDIMARVLQVPLQAKLASRAHRQQARCRGAPCRPRSRQGTAGRLHLFFVNSGIVSVTPLVMKNAGFDGVKDFRPVRPGSTAPLFVVHQRLGPANGPAQLHRVREEAAQATGLCIGRCRLVRPPGQRTLRQERRAAHDPRPL
jgi:tripartite-type tricarboxylate transporter receptor subunit TctC